MREIGRWRREEIGDDWDESFEGGSLITHRPFGSRGYFFIRIKGQKRGPAAKFSSGFYLLACGSLKISLDCNKRRLKDILM